VNATETARGLAHAQDLLARTKQKADALVSREQDLKTALSRAIVTDGQESAVSRIKTELGVVSDVLNDVLAALPALEADVRRAAAAHREAVRLANVDTVKERAQALQKAAEAFEAALAAPRISVTRDAFVAAGNALLSECRARRIELPVGFDPVLLAHDCFTQRTRNPADNDSPDYNRPVPSFIAKIVAHVMTLQPEGITT